MARFYFDADDRVSISADKTGAEFPDARAALKDAHVAARQLSGESLKFNEPLRGRAIIVEDQHGHVLQRIGVDIG